MLTSLQFLPGEKKQQMNLDLHLTKFDSFFRLLRYTANFATRKMQENVKLRIIQIVKILPTFAEENRRKHKIDKLTNSGLPPVGIHPNCLESASVNRNTV